MDNFQELFYKAAFFLSQAKALIITAGAGMGVDSGLPDFRGKTGFWKHYPYAKKLGLSFEQLANPFWFEKDPHMAWAFYGHRLNLYRNTTPHHGFNILLSWADNMPYSYFIFTSNVDGQFQKAGFDPNKIVEIHGSIHYLQCTLPCSNKIWPADNIEVKIDFNQFKALDPLPKCPLCGRIARPNILMFNDFYWISSRTDKQEQKFNSWLDYLFKNKIPTIIFEIGAGTAVPTVRYTSENLALKLNAPLIRINPRDYQIPQNPKFIPIPHTALHALQNIDLILKKIQK